MSDSEKIKKKKRKQLSENGKKKFYTQNKTMQKYNSKSLPFLFAAVKKIIVYLFTD